MKRAVRTTEDTPYLRMNEVYARAFFVTGTLCKAFSKGLHSYPTTSYGARLGLVYNSVIVHVWAEIRGKQCKVNGTVTVTSP